MPIHKIQSGHETNVATRPQVWARSGFGVRFLVVYLTGLIMALGDVADGKLFHADVDNDMRALQIRTLLADGGGWFDLTLPMIATPDPYISPWSRLIDLPYVAITWIFGQFMPAEAALDWAFLIWPPVMLAVFACLCVLIIERLLRDFQLPASRYALILSLTTMLMGIGVLEFSPGRIDHHNAQLIAMMTVMLGLLNWNRVGGWLIGVGSALSIVIGLECLPFVVIAFAGVVVCFLAGVKSAEEILAGAAKAMLATSIVCAAAFLGPKVLQAQCDAFSAPYLLLMIGASAVLLGASKFVSDAGLAIKLLVLLIPMILLLGTMAWLYPTCLNGPYQMIDPLSRSLWFERIWQEKSFLLFYSNGDYNPVVSLTLQAVIVVCALPFILSRAKRDPGLCISFLIAVAALGLTLVVTRYIRFPAVLVPLFLPPATAYFIAGEAAAPRRWVAGSVAAVVATAVWFLVRVPPVDAPMDSVDFMSFDECKEQDFSVLSAVPPGRIAVPLGLSMPLVEDLPDGFSVANVPFHRAAPGMKRMFEAFTATDPERRRSALAAFDYVAVCRFKLRSADGDTALYATLSAGENWPGLIRIMPEGETDFQLFRIDHASLR